MKLVVVVVAAVLGLAACPVSPVQGEGEGEEGEEGEGEGEGEAAAVDFGFVFVVSEPDLGFAQAGAVFRRELPRAFDCAETEIAGCVVLECGAVPLAFDALSAGAIDVDGALDPISLAFDNGYPSLSPDAGAPLFGGGETLTASAAGDVVPAFSLQVTAPEVVTIDVPVWPAEQDDLAVTRSAGLHLEWSGASAGDVVVIFNTQDQATEVSCAFPAAAGTADVPAAALQALPVGAVFLDVEQRGAAFARIDTWDIRLQAATHALGGDQGPAIASVELD